MPNPSLVHDHEKRTAGDFDRRFAYVNDSAAVSEFARIGGTAEWVGRTTDQGTIIGERAIIRPFVTVDGGVSRATIVGADTLLCTGVYVGHDVRIGNRVQIAPHAVILGCVTIGDDVKIGANATINPHRVIGSGARVGSGAVVTKDVPPGEVWAGVPARKLERPDG